jgi:transposase
VGYQIDAVAAQAYLAAVVGLTGTGQSVNGVEPYAYLKAALEAIAAGHPAARIDELMPWYFGKQA